MRYQIGDTVIHWNYGPGHVTGIEEKQLAGKTRQYYVVETQQLTLWVPTDEDGEAGLRFPATGDEFQQRMDILRGAAESLPDDQYQRQNQLIERMRHKTLDDVCHIIRDLTTRAGNHKLNHNDTNILKRAEELLLDEWELALGVSRDDARLTLDSLLK